MAHGSASAVVPSADSGFEVAFVDSEWAKAQGIEVKDRGRVPAELVIKFKAATGN